MASLKGLPPLPKSLSGLLNFSSAQRKEMERIHAMRTMIQQDLSRSSQQQQTTQATTEHQVTDKSTQSPTFQNRNVRKTSSLDVQLALLRKEMVGLRQLDMSLLCQLWSLNESLLEYKHLLMEDRLSRSLSHSSSPGWDNGFDDDEEEEEEDDDDDDVVVGRQSATRRRRHNLQLVEEDVISSLSSSTSHSSLEFGDV